MNKSTVQSGEDLVTLQGRVARMYADTSTPDSRLSDDPMKFNPVVTSALTKLMLGGLPKRSDGYPLHCSLRYFDPERQRATGHPG